MDKLIEFFPRVVLLEESDFEVKLFKIVKIKNFLGLQF
jgi:RNA-binding protein YlmH